MIDDSSSIYPSNFLIDRIYSSISLQAKKVKLPEIVVKYEKPKTCFYKFNEICKAINRDILHVKKYFETELLAETSLNSDNNLLITGRRDVTKIKEIFQGYLNKYVICGECKNLNTTLEKNGKVVLKKCNNCNASKAIIKKKKLCQVKKD